MGNLRWWEIFLIAAFAAGIVGIILFGIQLVSAETISRTQETTLNEGVSIAHTVTVTASVPMGDWCNKADNWETTLDLYNGDEVRMLASQGFTPQSFEEYCLSKQ